MVLGFNEASWDDTTGSVRTPLAARKPWRALTANEQMAASLLGYNEIMWDNLSGLVQQPDVVNKQWSELTTCADAGDGAWMFVLTYLLI